MNVSVWTLLKGDSDGSSVEVHTSKAGAEKAYIDYVIECYDPSGSLGENPTMEEAVEVFEFNRQHNVFEFDDLEISEHEVDFYVLEKQIGGDR